MCPVVSSRLIKFNVNPMMNFFVFGKKTKYFLVCAVFNSARLWRGGDSRALLPGVDNLVWRGGLKALLLY